MRIPTLLEFVSWLLSDPGESFLSRRQFWPLQRARESAVSTLNERLASNPDEVNLRFELACLFTELGRTQEARNAYIDLLAREPSHRLALNNLGTLLHATGYRTAARIDGLRLAQRGGESTRDRARQGPGPGVPRALP